MRLILISFFLFFLRPKKDANLYIGKSKGSALPLFEAIMLSKYQASRAKRAASAYKTNIDVRSEYLSKVPPPKGKGPLVEVVKTYILYLKGPYTHDLWAMSKWYPE